ncbi:MAG: formate/nitrite transporter family protein [Muribaculaceae bacterium]|nr:formate/nitrite transporter family protein [Muribaculaceae bacterium]
MSVNSPKEVINAAVEVGKTKVGISSGNYGKLAVLSMLAGVYIAFGGILSLVIGFGFPEITAGNPSLQKLLSGCMFPIGLILVVLLGAELFTGNNALLIPAYMKKHYGVWPVVKNWILVYIGNFVGAMAFTYFLVYLCGLTAADPYHSAIIKVAEAKASMSWGMVFLKGIGANWCVCLAVWLALSSRSFVGKMAGCWLPVMAFVALGYEHSIANMFFIPLGMMEGANVEVMQAITTSFIPATLGNIVGGALFVGCAYGYINLTKNND